mmetsp:Transcript_41425/g.57655  ORF Transcript_41425/g.57655 Transcript_41425/m.57655 type:complete len:106 (+) Transcript_41425:61-378(+)
MTEKKEIVYTTFQDFYPFYLSEHSNLINRKLHIMGTSIVILLWCYVFFTGQYNLLWYTPLIGYGFAWVGHFFFEKNKPATFKYPLFSLRGDFKMWYECLTGQIPL